jgi:hypothetical protein
VYTLAEEEIAGWPYYKSIAASNCISYDTKYNHWWLQNNCTFLGSNVGLAWLAGQHECPHSCEDEGNK